jgi:hypothetical protein
MREAQERQTRTPMERLMVDETVEVEALERLEGRILAMVEQLREARRLQAAAESETEKLRLALKESESRAEAAEAEKAETRSSSREVRRRIETLLDRIESMEE